MSARCPGRPSWIQDPRPSRPGDPLWNRVVSPASRTSVIFFLCFAASILVLGLLPVPGGPLSAEAAPPVAQELIVRLRPATETTTPPAAAPAQAVARLDELLEDLDPAWRAAFPESRPSHGARGAGAAPSSGRDFLDQIHVLSFRDAGSRDAALRRLGEHPDVVYVEPLREILVETRPAAEPGGGARTAQSGGSTSDPGSSTDRSSPAVTPGDTLYPQQWALEQIGMPAAWEGGTGTPGIIVALVDTGIETDHPDLTPNLAVNLVEAAGLPGVDDDDNGYVDDVHGWNVLAQNADIEDGYGHGTHIAGIVGAASDGTYGTVGVTWEVELLTARMFNDAGVGTNLSGAQGIVYAASRGAHIINMSWGTRQMSPVIRDAVSYAAATGAVLVAAAGNQSARVTDSFPAAYDEVIAVGATTSSDILAGFSNRGVALDVVAPGVNILSTQAQGHYLSSGTSQAAAVVSGVLAHLAYRRPGMGAEELRSILRLTALDLGRTGWDPAFGAGRVNAATALALPGAPVAAIQRPHTLEATASPSLKVIADTEPGSGTTGPAEFFLDVGESADPLAFEPIAAGPGGGRFRELGVLSLVDRDEGEFTVRLRVRDASGLEAEDRVLLLVDRTAPALVSREHADRLAGRRFQQLVRYAANERVTGRVFLREAGSGAEFSVIPSDEGYIEHVADLTGLYPGKYEYLIEISDLAGHRTWVDAGDGAPFARTVLPPIELASHDFVSIERIEGFELGAVADLDGDGGPELLGESYGFGVPTARVTVLAVGEEWPREPGLERRTVELSGLPTAAGDVDGDGVSEVLVADDEGLFLVSGLTPGEIAVLWTTDWGDRRVGGSLVDVDGDRDAELIFSSDSARLVLLDWRGGTFEDVELGFTRTTRAAGHGVADYDGDGRTEIALGSLAGEVVVLEAHDGRFIETTRESFFARIANAVTGIHVEDADGDGRPEFAIYAVGAILNREQRPTLGVFEAAGDDRYVPFGHVEFTDKNTPYDNALAAGDVDGDGRVEILLAQARHVYLFDSDRDDRMLPVWYAPRAGGGRAAVRDLDGDGLAEILITERTGDGPVTTIYGRARVPLAPALTWRAVLHPLGNEIQWEVVGDPVFDLAVYRLEPGEIPGIESDLADRRIFSVKGELAGRAGFRDEGQVAGPARYLMAYTTVEEGSAPGTEIRRRVLEGPLTAASSPDVPMLLLLAPYPNPTPGAVTVPLALAGPAPVTVTIFDLNGRARRQLWDGELPAGVLELPWDGRDEQGRILASGVYFVRARSPLGEAASRLVLVRR